MLYEWSASTFILKGFFKNCWSHIAFHNDQTLIYDQHGSLLQKKISIVELWLWYCCKKLFVSCFHTRFENVYSTRSKYPVFVGISFRGHFLNLKQVTVVTENIPGVDYVVLLLCLGFYSLQRILVQEADRLLILMLTCKWMIVFITLK